MKLYDVMITFAIGFGFLTLYLANYYVYCKRRRWRERMEWTKTFAKISEVLTLACLVAAFLVTFDDILRSAERHFTM